jgi:hypothetical protein
MAENDSQLATVRELYRRRDTLAADQRAVVDELAKRYGLSESPKPATSLSQQLGIENPVAAAPLDFVEGVGAGVLSTAGNLLKLGGKVMPAVGPAREARAALESRLDSLGTPPDSFAGKAGEFVEQAAEFFVPAGAVSRGAKAVEAATKGARHAKAINLGARAALEGASAAGVTAAQTGDAGEAAKAGVSGGATSAGLQAVAPVVQKALPLVRNRLNATQRVAMEWAENHGIPLSTGQRTGNRMVTQMERGLENTYGSAGRTQQFFADQEQKLEGAGRTLFAQSQPGRLMNEYEAGENLAQRIKGVISDAKKNADTLYDDVRSRFEQHTRPVQVGVDKAGKPVYQDMALPVDVTLAKISLQPVYEELSRTMPELKRQSSPGYRALHELLNGPDVMDAATADRNLSALKALARGGNNPYLNTRSQGLAKKAIADITTDFNNAVNAADPSIMPVLQQARGMVRKQHTVAEILDSLPDEPAALYKRLSQAGDRTYNDLAFLNNYAPAEMRQIGRTYLEGLMNKATETGGITRADGIFRSWQNLGPKTKLLLFGNKQNVDELNKFFLATKMLTKDVNPSGSTKLLASIFGLPGAAVDALVFTPGGPEEKAKRFAYHVGVVGGFNNVLSRVLLSPGGAKLLTSTMKLPPASAGFRQGVNAIQSLLSREEREKLQATPATEEAAPEPAPAPAKPAAGKYAIVAPDGKTYTFSSPGAANAFKKAAGIQ